MDRKTLILLGLAAVGAASASAGAQLGAGDHVSLAAVLSAVLTTVFAFVQKSPIGK